MSKITKKDRIAHLEFQVAWLTDAVHELQGTANPESKPKLKKLNQSVFDGLDEKWRWAAVDEDGSVAVYLARPICNYLQWYVEDKSLWLSYKYFSNKKGYDASNWQNSLIERDTTKELLEVDLSSELTGSDLARAMLEQAKAEQSEQEQHGDMVLDNLDRTDDLHDLEHSQLPSEA